MADSNEKPVAQSVSEPANNDSGGNVAPNAAQNGAEGMPQPGPVPYDRFKDINDQLKAAQTELTAAKDAEKALKEAELKKQEKWQELAEARETELTAERLNNQRLKVGMEMELPAELVDRLRGDDEAALRKDAETLKQFLKPAGGPGVPPAGGGKPASFDLSNMSPEQIRGKKKEIFRDMTR